MLGPGAIVWDWATPTLTGWTRPASMPARAACRLAFLHSSRIRPVLIKVPAPAPRHCTWDGRKPCPTEAHAHATPRYAILCHTLPCHPNQSPFHQSPGLSRLRRPAIALTVNRLPRTHGNGRMNPLPYSSVLGTRLLCCVWNTWTRRCLRGGVLTSPARSGFHADGARFPKGR